MADGARVLSHGRWIRDVTLGGQTARTGFEIFSSGGGWSLLFGKPLLRQFRAIHDYGEDKLMIPLNNQWTTLVNKHGNEPIASRLGLSWHPSNTEHWKCWHDACVGCGNIGEHRCELTRGNSTPPSRQVQSPNQFSVLEYLGDAILENELDQRYCKYAYIPPELQEDQVPQVAMVTIEKPYPHLQGGKNQGCCNH